MKKTVSIQISGMLFHVDDDAYDALDAYLQSIRTHFAHLADRDEILSDIESRIAEKFSEKLKKSKQTVTLHDVEALMKTMGTVEDFEAFEEESEEKPHGDKSAGDTAEEKHKPRRLYRNPDDKVIAGVASGIATYFSIDPVIVRVIFVIFGFMHGIGVIAYIVLWIAMPLAKTHSERMEMQGQPMTLSGLEKKIQRSTHTFKTEDFTSIQTSGGIKLHIREGKECKVAARGAPHDLENMDIHVVDGELRLQRIQGSWLGFLFHGFRHLSFDITLPDLKEVKVSGACAVEVDGFDGKEIRMKATGASTLRANTHAKILHIHVEGASSAKVTGDGDTIYATAIGASSLNARHFKAAHGHADISGASSAHLYAEKNVDGQATGASSLCVYGAPTVTAKASGASSVRNRDAADPEPQEWHHGVTFHEHKKYTNPAPLPRFFYGIVLIIQKIVIGVLRIIGGIISVVTGIAMAALIMGTIIFLKTGRIPYLDFTPGIAVGTPFFYLITAIGFVLVFVPLVLVMQMASSIAQRRKQFSISGLITLVILWFSVLMGAFFVGQTLLPTFQYNDQNDSSMQSFSVGSFHTIKADGTDTIHITKGTSTTVLARGSDEALQNLLIKNTDGVLTIDHKKNEHQCFFCTVSPARVDISMPTLANASFDGITQGTIDGFSGGTLTLSADGLAKVDADVSSYSLTVTADGASHIILSGTGNKLDLTTDGVSKVNGTLYKTALANVQIDGLSAVTLYVTDHVTGSVRGLSRLTLLAHPDVVNLSREHTSSVSLPYFDNEKQAPPPTEFPE